MRLRRSKKLARAIKYLQNVLNSAALVMAATIRADTERFPPLLNEIGGAAVRFLQAHAAWLVPVLLVFVPTINWLRRFTGDPLVWEHIHEILDQLSEKGVKNGDLTDHSQHHRATLFRHKKWHFSWSTLRWYGGWLVAVERSGHMKRSCAAFRAPEDGPKCEGVAGRAWSSPKQIYVDDLPDVRFAENRGDLEKYAKATYVSVERVKEARPAARSFLAFPVECNGRRWGVIVLDSATTEIRRNAVTGQFGAVAKTLSRLLARV